MGHYVLGHIPKQLAFEALNLFLLLYLGFRFVGWALSRWRQKWEIRGVDDWASLPVLILPLFVLSFIANPVVSAVSRHYEHQADQFGLEVTHGLTPDSSQQAARVSDYRRGGSRRPRSESRGRFSFLLAPAYR